MISQVSSVLHSRFSPRVRAIINATQAAVSPHEEEGLPSCKHARLSWSCRQTSTQRCRCARSHAPLATRAPFPPTIGRLDRTPSTEAHSERPLQLLRLVRTSRWRLMKVASQYVYQPHRPHRPGSHLAAPSLPILCTDAHGTPARTHNFQPAALWGRLGMNLPLPLQRTARLPRTRRCLPRRIRRDMPPRARARSTRPSTRPLSAARRCRHG